MQRWLTFDCYGTLIDWLSGLRDVYSATFPEADSERSLRVHRVVEPVIQEQGDLTYREVLARCNEAVAAVSGLGLRADRYAVADSVGSWPAFPEVAYALQRARDDGWHLAVLSNTDPDLLASSLDRIGVQVDATVTAAETRSYKPAIRHWEAFFEKAGVDKDHHVHVAASLFHDIEPALRLGLNTVWINRGGVTSDLPRSAELSDMSGLPAALGELPGLHRSNAV